MSSEEDRWTTKFLLKEHTEAYEVRYDKPMGDQPTVEEWGMIRDFILLPYMLTMIQRNIDQLRAGREIFKNLYAALAEEIASAIEKDMFTLRRELTRRSIHITTGEQDDIVLNYIYRYKGYSGTFGITREETRAQMGIRLARYTKDVWAKLKK
ncbi:MAG: hypothetical protein K0Q90_3958 [Paenibacillaceae bacterium]|jgi:hypothetical protein|nr:hypothetical protein [Paenibacillaceae bacterium]